MCAITYKFTPVNLNNYLEVTVKDKKGSDIKKQLMLRKWQQMNWKCELQAADIPKITENLHFFLPPMKQKWSWPVVTSNTESAKTIVVLTLHTQVCMPFTSSSLMWYFFSFFCCAELASLAGMGSASYVNHIQLHCKWEVCHPWPTLSHKRTSRMLQPR